MIRGRENFTCEHCGIFIPEGERQKAHCAHIIGRKWRGGRWHPENAVCLCASCHAVFTDNPLDWTRWLEKHLGHGHLELLQERRRQPIKYTGADRKDMLAHYRAERNRLLSERANGVTGRIEFAGWA